MKTKAITSCLALAAVVSCLMGRPQPAEAAVFIGVAPPAPIVEVVPPVPRVGYAWTPGYWGWNGGRYVWVRGAYALPPRVGAAFVPGRWVSRPRGWYFVRGHWR